MDLNVSSKSEILQPDAWQNLKKFTSARIALGSSGTAIPLSESLNFKMDHAYARDAVYFSLEKERLLNLVTEFELSYYHLHSQAENRLKYLQRPDLGRKLDKPSADQLNYEQVPGYDVSIILADGLSASAINSHAYPLLSLLIPSIKALNLKLAPITIVEQARVAISDEIGFLLKAKISLILIGERPGLSSPDSMGAYLTYMPGIGLTDESRNCVSNIRPQGLQFYEAAQKIIFLIQESLRLGLSGVELKENSPSLGLI